MGNDVFRYSPGFDMNATPRQRFLKHGLEEVLAFRMLDRASYLAVPATYAPLRVDEYCLHQKSPP